MISKHFVMAIVALALFAKVNSSVIKNPYPYCDSKPGVLHCNIACATDPDCEVLGYDLGIITCDCGCQICPNGKIYGHSVIDYENSQPLTKVQRNQCPDVRAPCKHT